MGCCGSTFLRLKLLQVQSASGIIKNCAHVRLVSGPPVRTRIAVSFDSARFLEQRHAVFSVCYDGALHTARSLAGKAAGRFRFRLIRLSLSEVSCASHV
jgi:hypothetical protein